MGPLGAGTPSPATRPLSNEGRLPNPRGGTSGKHTLRAGGQRAGGGQRASECAHAGACGSARGLRAAFGHSCPSRTHAPPASGTLHPLPNVAPPLRPALGGLGADCRVRGGANPKRRREAPGAWPGSVRTRAAPRAVSVPLGSSGSGSAGPWARARPRARCGRGTSCSSSTWAPTSSTSRPPVPAPRGSAGAGPKGQRAREEGGSFGIRTSGR